MFHRRSNEKVLPICSFPSDRVRWLGLECINDHNDKKYKMLDCKEDKNISYSVVHPSQSSQQNENGRKAMKLAFWNLRQLNTKGREK
jgi:hypothetical protein